MVRLARGGRARVARAGLALALLGHAASASAPRQGVTHVVRPGENLYRISRYYGVPVPDLVDANRVRDVTNLEVGQRLWVPGALRGPASESLRPDAGPTSDGEERRRAEQEADLRFHWPLHGRLGSRFGWRDGRRHEGIDLLAEPGTPIRAAEAGRVIHAGSDLGDYGRVVIIKHAGHYQTIYAHNRRNLVRPGDFVERGQVIAEVGTSGNADGAHVHFEIRRDRRPLDPARYLP
jgi:murein DD-endopeptidase MepM/ murein hydrolase activator NlpD